MSWKERLGLLADPQLHVVLIVVALILLSVNPVANYASVEVERQVTGTVYTIGTGIQTFFNGSEMATAPNTISPEASQIASSTALVEPTGRLR